MQSCELGTTRLCRRIEAIAGSLTLGEKKLAGSVLDVQGISCPGCVCSCHSSRSTILPKVMLNGGARPAAELHRKPALQLPWQLPHHQAATEHLQLTCRHLHGCFQKLHGQLLACLAVPPGLAPAGSPTSCSQSVDFCQLCCQLPCADTLSI